MTDLMYPTEVIQLPSQGKFYPEGHPLRENGGKLDVKYMTAKEEDILTSTNLIANGTVVDKLMESLVVHEGVDYKDLTTGDANAVLMASRVLAYGKDYPVTVTCGQCKENTDTVIDLSQLETPDELVDVDDNGHYSFKTPKGLEVTIKTLTRGEEMKVEKDNKAIEAKVGKGFTHEVTSRLKSIIVSINGVTDRQELSNMIDNLVIMDSKFIREEFNKVNPSVDMTIEVDCNSCGHTIKGAIPIGIDFLWPDAQL
jgi:hypothetical protein